MLISVCGGAATAKTAVVGILTRQGYEHLSYDLIPIQNPPKPESRATIDLKHAFMRTQIHLQAQEVMERRDVVIVRTAWESMIFAEASFKRQYTTEDDLTLMRFYVDSINPLLKPPHAAIWLRAKPMTSFDRAKLKEQAIDEDYFRYLAEGYEKFMAEVAVPVIEIEADRPFDQIKNDVEYGIGSLKSAHLLGHSVWTRRFFR